MPEHRHKSSPSPPSPLTGPLNHSRALHRHMHIGSTHNACARGHHERASHITALDPLSTVLGLSLLSVISESVCGRGDLPPCRCSPHNSCTAHPLISALHTLLSTHARLCPCVSFIHTCMVERIASWLGPTTPSSDIYCAAVTSRPFVKGEDVYLGDLNARACAARLSRATARATVRVR